MRDLYKFSSQDLYERSLYKSSLQDLFTGPHMRHLYTRSPDIPGPPRSPCVELSTKSLHKNSMRDLYTRALEDLLVSLDLLGLFTGALQDLFSRPL